MPVTGQVRTIFSDAAKQNAVFPRTKINAITDSEGNSLQSILDSKGGSQIISLTIATTDIQSSSTYTDYPYVYTTQVTGLTASDFADCPNEIDNYSGAYMLETTTGTLNIYFANEPTTTLTITVVIEKGQVNA